MENTFKCPKCGGVLSQDGNLIFAVENKTGQRSLLMLSTKLGDYGIKNTLPFRFDVGDKFNFYCPVCQTPLECEEHEDLIKVEMTDDSDHTYQVCFSRVAGEQSTYRISGKNVTAYGQDAGKYENLIKEVNL
ncbi:MAG: hypothetical protein ACQESM_00955 [Bacteroidota bacterium]